MRFTQSLITALLAGGALAFPLADMFTREVVPEQGEIDFTKMFDGDTPVVPLAPVSETNGTLTKRKERFDLKDQITLSWKNGA
jgi:hypothetical protein